MDKSVLICGPESALRGELLSLLEDYGFPCRTLIPSMNGGLPDPGTAELLFWLLEPERCSAETVAEITQIVWPSAVKVLVLPSGTNVEDTQGFDHVLKDPLQASEVLVLLSHRFPEDIGMDSDLCVGDWVEFSMGSSRQVFESMRRFLRAMMTHSALAQEQVYHIHHAICEMLINAMEHGNNFDPGKRVKGAYVLFEDRLVVKLDDQGCGFIPTSIPDPTEAPAQVALERTEIGKRPGGYGLALTRKWMDMVYSDRGNSVLLTREFSLPSKP